MSQLEDKTDIIHKPLAAESRVWSVSVRGWLAIAIIGTICASTLSVVLAAVSVAIYTGSMQVLAGDPVTTMFSGLKELGFVALAYYFAKEEREHIGRPRKPTMESTP